MTVAVTETTSDDVRWLYEVLGADREAAPVPYLARPSLDEVQLLLPTEPPAAAAASLRRLHGNRDLRGRAEIWAGRLLGRLGLLGLAPGQAVSVPRFELVDHLARVLGEPDLVAAVTLGPPRRNRKPVLQLLRPDGRVVGFAKIGWSALTKELVSNEADVLQAIDGRLPTAVVAPALLTVEHWRDLVVVVTAELRPPMFESGQRPSTGEVVAAIAGLGSTGRRPVPELATLREGRNVGLEQVVDLDRLLDRHGDVNLDTGLWHGDFTPWNVAPRGRSVLIWDWEFAGWDRPVGFDALHHRFEHHRRRPGGTNRSGLAAVVGNGSEIVAELGLEPDGRRSQAIIDLYLCELIARERKLADQRWPGGALATLGPDAAQVLARRLA